MRKRLSSAFLAAAALLARKAGVIGTPTFFFAVTDPASSKVKTVVRLGGAQPYAAFKAQIDRLLVEGAKPAAEAEKGQPK